MTPDDLKHETAIVWLVNTEALNYARQTMTSQSSRAGFPQVPKWRGVLVGYAELGPDAPLDGNCLRSMRRRTLREFDQGYWYEPGELTPERLPDLGAAVER